MMRQWFCKYHSPSGIRYCIKHGEKFSWVINKSNLIWYKEIPREQWGQLLDYYFTLFEMADTLATISFRPRVEGGELRCAIHFTVVGDDEDYVVDLTMDQARQTSMDILSMIKGAL